MSADADWYRSRRERDVRRGCAVRRRGTARGSGVNDAARLARIRRAIESGEYETTEKLESALRGLLADLRRMPSPPGPSRGGESGGGCP